MFNVFKSEIKHLWSTPWRRVALLLLLIIPLLYGGVFMIGFWKPIAGMSKLNIGVINNDYSNSSIKLTKSITDSNSSFNVNDRVYKLNIKDASSLYVKKQNGKYSSSDSEVMQKVQEDVNEGKIDGAFVIPKDFSKKFSSELTNVFTTTFSDFISNISNGSTSSNKYLNAIRDLLLDNGFIIKNTNIIDPNNWWSNKEFAKNKGSNIGDTILQKIKDFENGKNGSLKIPTSIVSLLASSFKDADINLPRIEFFNSYKSNYLVAEITSFFSHANILYMDLLSHSQDVIDNSLNNLTNKVVKKLDYLYDSTSSGYKNIETDINNLYNKIVKNGPAQQIKNNTLISGLIKTVFNGSKNQVKSSSITPLTIEFLKLFISKIPDALKTNIGTQNIIKNINVSNNLDDLINFVSIGKSMNTYGKGMSPYFISIAIWSGSLVSIFLFKNHRVRNQNKYGTFKNYFGKSLIWLLTAIVQTTLLWICFASLWSLTTNTKFNWTFMLELYLYMLFLCFIFSMFVQGVAYLFRFGELGSFAVLIILVTQLSSSSGTFPVEMQKPVFSFFHKFAPFTFSIDSIRLLFSGTISKNNDFIFNQIYLSIYLLIIPVSLFFNYLYDKKTYKKYGEFRSYEIHMGDE